jgi:hypothetical protein
LLRRAPSRAAVSESERLAPPDNCDGGTLLRGRVRGSSASSNTMSGSALSSASSTATTAGSMSGVPTSGSSVVLASASRTRCSGTASSPSTDARKVRQLSRGDAELLRLGYRTATLPESILSGVRTRFRLYPRPALDRKPLCQDDLLPDGSRRATGDSIVFSACGQQAHSWPARAATPTA